MFRSVFSIMVLVLTVCLCLVNTGWAQHAHEGDIIVGRTLAGQLAIEANLDETIVLAPSVHPVFAGWIGDEPGFDHFEADEPAEDFYTLASGADIYLNLLSADTGLQFADALTFQTLNEPTDAPLPLGDHELHLHILFNISSDILPAYDGSPLSATLQLVDLGSIGYSASEPFTMTFTPEPMTATLLVMGGLGLLRRRKALC